MHVTSYTEWNQHSEEISKHCPTLGSKQEAPRSLSSGEDQAQSHTQKIVREAMDLGSNPPMNLCHVNKLTIFINRTYTIIHSIALSFLLYYRASFFFNDAKAPILPWLIVFAAELLFSFEWLLTQAYRWRPVSRTVFPERLPEDDKLPAIDVFICTADPVLEPTVAVMNTVISAMALDYPPEKLHVYLSDDAGADVTLNGMREAWAFAKRWIPFCKRYKIKRRSPKAYFSAAEDDNENGDLLGGRDFIQERRIVQEKYEVFEERVREYAKHGDAGSSKRGDHSAVIEVIQDSSSNQSFEENEAEIMPLLVYVSREKRPYHAHHFKAGAINVLLRVSGVISNSPFILGLDCDTNCNDPSSARQAMCFHLDPKLSPTLSFVQFPQKFHNISKNDIYDSQYRSIFKVQWYGFDGLQGPGVCGTGYYIKRLSLYGKSLKQDHKDLMELRQSVGPSNEFITSLLGNSNPNKKMAQLAAETQQLASCTYEDGTKWGEEIGLLYASVAEDFLTGFASLHCKGWTSVYSNPPRPQFLGRGFTNLNDFLVQGTRWSSAVVDIAISKYCPLIYGPSQISFLQRMCYALIAVSPLSQFFSLWCLATIPQLCLVKGISLYPEVSNSYFWICCFVFLSSVSRTLHEVLTTGASLQHWIYEQRIWMMNAVTSHLYGTLDVFMKKFGLREASFAISNKVDDVEQLKRYHAGVFDFQTSALFLVPLASLVILNMASFCVGIARVIFLQGELEKLFIQVFIPFYIVVMNYPIIEGMLIRKDNGRIPPSVTLISAAASIVFFVLGPIIFM